MEKNWAIKPGEFWCGLFNHKISRLDQNSLDFTSLTSHQFKFLWCEAKKNQEFIILDMKSGGDRNLEHPLTATSNKNTASTP